MFVNILYYLFLTIFFGFLISYVYFKYCFQYWKKRGVIFLEPSFPFGNIKKCVDGRTHISDIIRDVHDQIKTPYAGAYFLSKPVLFVKDPAMLKYILIKDFNNFSDRGVYSDRNTDPLSLHLFRLPGEKWRMLRTKLTPMFTSCKLKSLFHTTVKSAHQLQNALGKIASSGEFVDVSDICSRYTVDVISTLAFGVETNSFLEPLNEMCTFIQYIRRLDNQYFDSVKQNLGICVPELLVLLKQNSHSNFIIKFMFDIVQKVVDYRFDNKEFRKDFLQLLIQLKSNGKINNNDDEYDEEIYKKRNNNEFITFDDLVAQIYVFITAGYDTSATTMTNCLYELAKQPEIQLKIQKNIDQVLNKYNGEFTFDSLKEIDSLANALAETLRKYPPLGFLNRIAKDKYKVPNSDLIIEKNMPVVISIAGIQNDPKYFENPQQFDPDRFCPENKHKIQPFTYLPYGDGPRICIGKRLAELKMMIGLAMTLSEYNFEMCSETPNELTHVCGQVILTAAKRVKLRITKRK